MAPRDEGIALGLGDQGHLVEAAIGIGGDELEHPPELREQRVDGVGLEEVRVVGQPALEPRGRLVEGEAQVELRAARRHLERRQRDAVEPERRRRAD